MARKVDIEYVRYYSPGSEARKLNLKPQRRNPVRPARSRQIQSKQIIALDPVMILGTVAALCMLVMMVVGAVKLAAAQKQEQQLERYLLQLQQSNVQLEDTYHAGFDPAEIQKQALALGLVPMDQVPQIPIQVEIPAQAAPQPQWYDGIITFLTGLFA